MKDERNPFDGIILECLLDHGSYVLKQDAKRPAAA